MIEGRGEFRIVEISTGKSYDQNRISKCFKKIKFYKVILPPAGVLPWLSTCHKQWSLRNLPIEKEILLAAADLLSWLGKIFQRLNFKIPVWEKVLKNFLASVFQVHLQNKKITI